MSIFLCNFATCLKTPEMKFAIIGYGKMGHAVESAALRRNHQIVCTIDNPSELEARLPQLRQADVARPCIDLFKLRRIRSFLRHRLQEFSAFVCK